MTVYEVQLGRIADGAKNGDIDYYPPIIVLVISDHYPNIAELESKLHKEIIELNCDCVYGITPCEEWELDEYECYQKAPKFYN